MTAAVQAEHDARRKFDGCGSHAEAGPALKADRLEIAISGRGAFRRFKDVLARWPGELDRWYAFSAERQRGRARAWLADAGYYVRTGLPPS